MVTLDSLIARFGSPSYIKIDVEGCEDQVLSGLSNCPPLLSFEFNRVFLEPALRALDNPIFANAEFNYTSVDPVKFELPNWVDKDQLKQHLAGTNSVAGIGDIFARRPI
jgi:hypothetical protein